MYPNPQSAIPLPPRPNLEQYKKLAKDLVKACKSGDGDAIQRWARDWMETLLLLQQTPSPSRARFEAEQIAKFAQSRLTRTHPGNRACALSDAQFIIARVHGFESWPKLAKHLEGLSQSQSPVSNFEAAAEAIVTGDLPALVQLMRQDPALVHARSTREHKATLLHYVAANGVENYRQKTPKNIVEVARVLLDSGAEVNAECDVYGGGATTLGLAATSVHPEQAGVQIELMQLLLERGAVIETGKQSAVVGCLANGRRQAAEFLASRGARLDLEGACGIGRLDVVRTFFTGDGSLKSNATLRQMRDGFAWACQYGRKEIVEFLLAHGVDVTTPPKDETTTALHWAAYGGHIDIVKLILERNPPLDARDKTYDGTPLDWALHGWAHPTDSAKRDNYYEVVALLARAGAKVDEHWLAQDPDWPTAEKLRADTRMLAALRGSL